MHITNVFRVGQKEDCHFSLLSSMQLLEQLVSEPFVDETVLAHARFTLNKKDRNMRGSHSSFLEASAQLGYDDPNKIIKDVVTCCPYILCFPDIAVLNNDN